MEILNIIPDLSKLTGIPQGTLLLLMFLIVKGANVTARAIPETATGWQGYVRRICAIIGVYVPSKVAPGISITDIAKAALNTPPLDRKARAEARQP